MRRLYETQTEHDLDTRFIAKQKELILKLLRGLADHPIYGPAMANLATKGVDIKIIADFTGNDTGNDDGRIYGRNPDGTIDQGESITIYINMQRGGEPVGNFLFAEAVLHDLIHSLGVPSFDAQLDASGSTLYRELLKQILSGYDFLASAEPIASDVGVIDAPPNGAALVGSAG